jgi:riboflavin biosynthesis pyrimidine reductase
MITTPDGVTSLGGTALPLGGPADLAILKALRRAADVTLVGAGTYRLEHEGFPARPDFRAVVVSKSCDIPFDTPLFQSGGGTVATTLDAPQLAVPTIRAGRGDVDLLGILQQMNATVIQCEGGPMLNAALLNAGLIDAMHVTFSHKLAGFKADPITAHTLTHHMFTPVSMARGDDFVFVRYEKIR